MVSSSQDCFGSNVKSHPRGAVVVGIRGLIGGVIGGVFES